MDSYEEHNMTGQFVGADKIGTSKVDAITQHISQFSPACAVVAFNEAYTKDSPSNPSVMCGFDNMVARRTAFENWKEVWGADKGAVFMDGRLTAEHLQIFTIQGGDEKAIAEYEKHLFADSEVAEEDCTFKQTSHCAAMIASHMVGVLTNWASNQVTGVAMRPVSFLFEFSIPLNMIL
jgi:hypothetical protein